MSNTATTEPASYGWAWFGHRVPAEIVAGIIQKIVDQEGSCPPGRLVDAARSPLSPIHDLFEWDDRRAAERWRTQQARRVISNITVTYADGERTYITPAFVSVGHMREAGADEARPAPGYLRIGTALDDPALRRELLATAKRQLDGLRLRYTSLRELASVWEAIDRLEE